MSGRAFVTGATGQDGSYLVEALIQQHWDVHILIREDGAGPAGVTRHQGDLTEHEKLSKILESCQPDVVFNLAGVSSVAFSWSEPALTSMVSGTAVAQLLETCLRIQNENGRVIRFVQASSAEVFGNATESPQTERTPILPVSPYGAAKAYAQHMVGIYRQRGMHASSAILYNHESPRRPETFVTRKITSGVARIAAGLQDNISLGNLDARRDWGWAPDYVDAMLRMADSPSPSDFVIATGESHTVREFVEAAFLSAGIASWEPHVLIDSRFNRPAEAQEMRGDASSARSKLGWCPTKNFEEIVAAMVAHDMSLLEANKSLGVGL
ncbi:GDP-mannose 4,6-dehydratase [Pseudarthrobacter scleromae]|uniref:GDP-mannose 4,6-dehydratase n=1 Tax=Pseudarthrobacter scleromae TaxID=158897 RepID=UPI003D0850F8